MYDEQTKLLMEHAKTDLQNWMANAPHDTTEQAISAWQAGYIAGIQRGSIQQTPSDVEEI